MPALQRFVALDRAIRPDRGQQLRRLFHVPVHADAGPYIAMPRKAPGVPVESVQIERCRTWLTRCTPHRRCQAGAKKEGGWPGWAVAPPESNSAPHQRLLPRRYRNRGCSSEVRQGRGSASGREPEYMSLRDVLPAGFVQFRPCGQVPKNFTRSHPLHSAQKFARKIGRDAGASVPFQHHNATVKVVGRKMCVAHRHRQCLVAEPHLDAANVDAALHKA